MKCVECGREIPAGEEMERCPACKKFTLRKIEGTVITEPEIAENMSGEKFIYFTVRTADREVPVEVKQGFETQPPVEKNDEVIIECHRMKERIDGLRVHKLENKRRRIIFNYKGGCLLSLVAIIFTVLALIWAV